MPIFRETTRRKRHIVVKRYREGLGLYGLESDVRGRTMPMNRIDVHTHLVPPFWADELRSHGGDPSGWGQPEWSPESLLSFMKDEEISMSLLSLTAPGVEGWKGEARVDIVRRVNDYGAELVRDHLDSFGYLATLALPDDKAGLEEVRTCVRRTPCRRGRPA